jgi:hypothetical protein
MGQRSPNHIVPLEKTKMMTGIVTYLKRVSRIYSRLLLVVALLLSFATGAYSETATWCGKLPGLLERNYAYDESGPAIKLAEALAGAGEPFLYIRQTSVKTQALASSASAAVAITSASDKSKDVPKITAAQAQEMMKDPELQPVLNNFVGLFKESEAEPNWYFYSNSARFSNYFARKVLLETPEKGAVLLMDKAGEEKFLNRAVTDVAQYLNVGLILVEGATSVDFSLPRNAKSHPLILKLQTAGNVDHNRLSERIETADLLQSAKSDTVSVLFLMPETKADARAWGFNEEKSAQYATNGKRIMRDLDNYGLTKATAKPKSREAAVAAVNAASGSKRSLIVVVGESGDGGGVRVPGSTEVLRPEDLSSSTKNMGIVGLVCNSQKLLAERKGLGVIGTIYTDQIRAIARIYFDNRDPASYREYLDVPYKATATPASHLIDSVASVAKHMTVDAEGSHEFPVLFTVISQPSSSTGANATDSSAGVAQNATSAQELSSNSQSALAILFLSGVVGALGREILRWRRLSSRRRADLFRKPKYLAISAVQVILGGAVAVIFGRLASDPWTYVIGFVSGAGLEELVRRAMKLQVWTPPVAHGAGESEDASLLEYLRA